MKKSLLAILSLFLFVVNTFALQASISTDSNNIDINKPISLYVKIKGEGEKSINVKKISGIENFKILGNSKSQSSSISQVIINGKTTMKSITTYILYISLQAKKAGTYTIGPVIIDADGKEYKTNSIKVNVSGAKIMLNNTNLPHQNSKNNNNTTNNNLNSTSSSPPIKDNIQDLEKNVKKIDSGSEINYYYLLLLFIILLGGGIIFYIFKDDNDKKNTNIENTSRIEEPILIDDIKNENTYDLDNLNSLEEIDKYLRDKISKKYNIEDINYKSYGEILNLVDNENIKFILNKLEEVKYAGKEYSIDELKNDIKNLNI